MKQTKQFDKPLLFRAKIPYRQEDILKYLLWPVARVIRFFETMYTALMDSLWSELIKGERTAASGNAIETFFLFILLSYISFTLEEYEVWLFVGAVALWGMDAWFARKNFHNASLFSLVALETHNDKATWKSKPAQGNLIREEFPVNDITQVLVVYEVFKGGAFREEIGSAWRIYLLVGDRDAYLLYDANEVTDALTKAEKIAKTFDVPLEIAGGEAKSDFMDGETKTSQVSPENKRRKALQCQTVKVKRRTDGYTIASAVSYRNIWPLLRKALRISGLLLFALIVAGVMIRFGELIHFYVGPFFGAKVNPIPLDAILPNIIEVFWPDNDWKQIAIFCLSLGMIFYSMVKLFSRKKIVVTETDVTFQRGSKIVAKLETASIKHVFYVGAPKPLLVVTDANRNAIIIDDLVTEEEYEAFMYRIKEGVERFLESERVL